MWRFLKNLEIELPYDPAIPLLGIQNKENRIERDTCTLMFIAALFIIARTWKQPRCLSADEWVRKQWYMYIMEYYSAIKKNKIMSFAATWMNLEIVILSKVSHRKTNIMCYHLNVKSKKGEVQMNLFTEGEPLM